MTVPTSRGEPSGSRYSAAVAGKSAKIALASSVWLKKVWSTAKPCRAAAMPGLQRAGAAATCRTRRSAFCQARRRAGDADAHAAHALVLEASAARRRTCVVHRRRRRLARVDRVDLAVARGVDGHEAAAADAARVGLDDAEHAGGGDRGVDGVAAAAQDVDRGLRGLRIDGRGAATGADGRRLLGGGGSLVGGGRGGDERGGQDGEEQAAHARALPSGRTPLILPPSPWTPEPSS